MKLQATIPVRVFIDKKWYGNTLVEHTDVGKIPVDRREDLSWKGCYYTILPNEVFTFTHSNDWDRCFFKLENGAEFVIWCTRPQYMIDNYSLNVI